MRFRDASPEYSEQDGKGQISFLCPLCLSRIVLYFSRSKPQNAYTWLARSPEKCIVMNWDMLTLEPSIQNHPVSRKQKPCPAHFSVIDGEIVMA